MEQNPNGIQVGDLVQVQTGGPVLRVVELIENGRATCEPVEAAPENRIGNADGPTTETYDLSQLVGADQSRPDEGFVDMTGI
jgi:uncharacterized protein YodC (DUF2158 family)